MAERSIRDFQVPFGVAALADAWANANHFGLVEVEADGSRHYQRGSGLLTGQMHCLVRQSGPNVRIEAWIHATLLARIGALFLIPTDMSIEAGGVRGVLPRKICRDAVDKLLAQLGQPGIDAAAPWGAPQTPPQAAAPPVPYPAAPYAAPPQALEPNRSRPIAIAVATAVEVVTGVVGVFVAIGLFRWADWYLVDEPVEGLVFAVMAALYAVTAAACFVLAWRLWSLQPRARLSAVYLAGILVGLYVVSAIKWDLEIGTIVGIIVQLGLGAYLSLTRPAQLPASSSYPTDPGVPLP